MQRSRNNLWYSLALATAGGLLIRLSFSLNNGSTAVMAIGVLALLAAMIVFWFNFWE
jgi:hypothetical protein